jgi:hypothetical protein
MLVAVDGFTQPDVRRALFPIRAPLHRDFLPDLPW